MAAPDPLDRLTVFLIRCVILPENSGARVMLTKRSEG
jgi:hypothetical protein